MSDSSSWKNDLGLDKNIFLTAGCVMNEKCYILSNVSRTLWTNTFARKYAHIHEDVTFFLVSF